jgi:hypothetical protein
MKVGNYRIPNNRLANLLKDVKTIYEHFKIEETGPDLIAHSLDAAPRGGAFLQKMVDLRAYGLIEGRGRKIKVSELGKLAICGSDDEKEMALNKIFNNIPLWSIFYSKYGFNIKEDNFWIDLIKITEIERFTAQKKANYVRNAYLSDIKFISNENLLKNESEQENLDFFNKKLKKLHDKNAEMDYTTKAAVIYIKFPGIGIVNLELIDEANISFAETILNNIRLKIQKNK